MVDNSYRSLLESLRVVSWSIIVLIGAALLVSIYVLKRSFLIAISFPGLFEWASEARIIQADVFGLAFDRFTFNFMWPIIIGAICLCFRFMVEKQIYIWGQIQKTDSNVLPSVIVALDPWLLTLKPFNLPGTSLLWELIAYTPITAILVNFVTISIRFALPARWPDGWALIVEIFSAIGFLLLTSGTGFFGSLLFRLGIRRMRATFEQSTEELNSV
jgi:hypothetical protein